MKPMTNELRTKIAKHVKNNLDISSLIKEVTIKGENFSGAIITELNRYSEDLSGLNLTNTVIGKEGETTNLSGCKMRNCLFNGAKFLGKVNFRKADARGSNFGGAFIPYFQYQYSDFRGAKFCSAVITIGSKEGLKAKFDKDFLLMLTKYWDVEK